MSVFASSVEVMIIIKRNKQDIMSDLYASIKTGIWKKRDKGEIIQFTRTCQYVLIHFIVYVTHAFLILFVFYYILDLLILFLFYACINMIS